MLSFNSTGREMFHTQLKILRSKQGYLLHKLSPIALTYQGRGCVQICGYQGGVLQWPCDTAVRTQYVLHVTSPVSLLTQISFHHTFCIVHTVHPVCSPLTLVVNITLTTIAHHIFSSVLAEPQYIY